MLKSSKHKNRVVLKPILIYTEGLCEKMFINHLKSHYSRNSEIVVKVVSGKGGTPANIVQDCVNYPGDYLKRIVVLDNDKNAGEMNQGRLKASQFGVIMIEHTPCLEGQFLSILKPGKEYDKEQSSWCKKEFEKNFIPTKKRSDIREYEKIFPKPILEKFRKKYETLNDLISLMEKD